MNTEYLNMKIPLLVFFLIASHFVGAQTRFTCNSTDGINDSLLVCLPFNGNSLDESGNGYNGTVGGASLTVDRFGNANSAYLFNGTSNYIDLGKNLPDATEISLSLWVKPTGNTTGPLPGFLFFEGDGACGKDVYLGYMNHNWYLGVTKGIGTINSLGSSALTPVDSALFNTWYHVVVTVTATSSKLYINGKLATTYMEPGSFVGNHFTPNLGCGFDGGLPPCGSPRGKYFNGGIDDVRFYNRAIDSNEVVILFQSPNPADTTNITAGLLFSFPFTGNTIDSSGNGYDGTVSGATLTTDRFGVANRAYLFNGNTDFIDLAKNIPDLTNLSISAWVKPTGNDSVYGSIFFEGDAACGNDLFLNYKNDTFYLCANKNGATLNSTLSSPKVPVPNGLFWKWYHVVWVMKPNESKLYINDSLIKTIIVSGSGVGNHFKPSIGSIFDGGGAPCGLTRQRFFDGKIDDIRCYSRVLSKNDIHALFTLGGIPGGISAQFAIPGFKAFPNPAVDKINLEGDFVGRYELFDIQGRLVKTGEFNQKAEFEVGDLNNGVFNLVLKSESWIMVHKLLIQHL